MDFMSINYLPGIVQPDIYLLKKPAERLQILKAISLRPISPIFLQQMEKFMMNS